MKQQDADLEYWDRKYKPRCMEILNQWKKLSPSGNPKILHMLVDKELGQHPDLREYIQKRRSGYMDPHHRFAEDIRDEDAFQQASSFF